MKEIVTFLEKPAGADEKAIQESIRQYVLGTRLQDEKILTAVIADDARIQSLLAGMRTVDKEGFIEAVKRRRPVDLYYYDMMIVMKNGNQATCSGLLSRYPSVKDSPREIFNLTPRPFSIEMEKRGEIWLVVFTKYLE